ncbi:MAG: nucleotidyltransferase family protein [Phreatobacter sp.]|uniref:nucleotidyltransferase family protein n=1 Tax=Phreatobacter sp. TaxID=1966341 RepID=UPI001A368640|nr:nucleotidyltransferase family protein [Phreatobacter sp.]MBL8570297.1 nucleotidyltransferase family protein [Phreatobacter sp.]
MSPAARDIAQATVRTEPDPAPPAEQILAAWLVWRSGRRGPIGDLSENAIDWMATVALAARDFALPMLATVLDDAGVRDRVPADAASYLDYALAANADGNAAIRMQVLAIGEALDAAGVTGVLLKGATWLFQAGPASGDRMMRDIDLLVASRDLDTAMRSLALAGFLPSGTIGTEQAHIHEWPLEHAEHPVSVEVHTALSTRTRMLSGPDMLAEAVSVAPGLAIPSPRHRILHNVIHGEIVNGNRAGGIIDLREAMDLGRLMQASMAGLDWAALAREADERGMGAALAGGLHKASFVSACPVPEPFARDGRGRRHLSRCLIQRRRPRLDRLLRPLANLSRGLAWERDAFALGLGERRDVGARLKVNRRRIVRAWTGLGRLLRG